MIDLKPILQHAIKAVERAIPLTLDMQAGITAVDKPDSTPVTAADIATQIMINDSLARVTPAFGMISEESSDSLSGNVLSEACKQLQSHGLDLSDNQAVERLDFGKGFEDYTWVLDPIDGTKGYIRGAQYAIALALLHQGEVVLGVLGCPRHEFVDDTGAVFFTAKGQKAWTMTLSGNISLMSVDAISNPEDLQLTKGLINSERNTSFIEGVLASVNNTKAPIEIDGMGKYAQIAGGQASAYLRRGGTKRKESIWDHAAGTILLQEAGGVVTDLHGKPLDFSQGPTLSANEGIIASNGHIHTALVDAAKPLL